MSDQSPQLMNTPPVAMASEAPVPAPSMAARQPDTVRQAVPQTGDSTRVRVHVDRLEVGGLAPQDQQRFVRALERELRDVAVNSVEPAGESRRAIHIPQVSAGRLRANGTPEEAAAQVARQIARQMQPRGETQVQAEEANHA